jgi:hypothetical protein
MTDPRDPGRDLDIALHDLAATFEISTPDYGERVLTQLTDEARSSVHRYGPTRLSAMRRLAIAAALVLVAVAVTIAVPASRHALASWFGFSGIDITRAPTQSTTPSPTVVTPAPLAAGRPVTLDEAQHASANRVRLPTILKKPNRILLRRDGAAVVVTVAYREAPNLQPTPETGYALIVTEIYDAGDPVLQKILHGNAAATSVKVRGRPGVFIAGPQEIITLDHTRISHGQPVLHEVAARASANTLIWSDGTTTYRLEGDFTQRAALAFAYAIG